MNLSCRAVTAIDCGRALSLQKRPSTLSWFIDDRRLPVVEARRRNGVREIEQGGAVAPRGRRKLVGFRSFVHQRPILQRIVT